MRKLVAVPITLATLVVVTTALAVVPSGGSRFKGTTSAPAIGHFKDPVSFKIASNGKKITGFKFGTLGCFGSGGPPPKKNPYAQPFNTGKVTSIAVDAKGGFSTTVEIKVGQVPTTTIVFGKFGKKHGKVTASGAITISQSFQGQTCGPSTISFKATAK